MKQKIVVVEFSTGIMVISEIHDSGLLRVGARISREQVKRLLTSGVWNVKRKEPTEASAKRRARSMSCVHRLMDTEISAAIYKPESDEGDGEGE